MCCFLQKKGVTQQIGEVRGPPLQLTTRSCSNLEDQEAAALASNLPASAAYHTLLHDDSDAEGAALNQSVN